MFFQSDNVIGSKIPLHLMLKFPQKKLSLPIRKSFIELQHDRTLGLEFI